MDNNNNNNTYERREHFTLNMFIFVNHTDDNDKEKNKKGNILIPSHEIKDTDQHIENMNEENTTNHEEIVGFELAYV